MEVIRDEELWKIAKKRADFKRHLLSYIVVNSFLWLIWYFTEGRHTRMEDIYLPWPIWSTFGWGIGIALNYFRAYHQVGTQSSVQKEYDKLLNQKK